MMTLDEAIKHCEEVAESKRKQVENGDWEKGSLTERNCLECADEHKQLAEWLKELKQLREQASCEDCVSREKLDKALYERFHEEDSPNNITEVRLGAVRNLVKNFPSVTPCNDRTVQDFVDKCREYGKQQKSEWIISFQGFPPEPTTTCKKCGFDRDYNINPRYFYKIKLNQTRKN